MGEVVPNILDFMGTDTAKLLGQLQWVATHRPLVQLGQDAIEYVTQYGVSMVLSESTVRGWAKMLEKVGVTVEPVTASKLAKDAAQVALQQLKTHPLDVLREVQHVAQKVQELSQLKKLPRSDVKHGELASAIMDSHAGTTFDSLLAAGRTIYEDGGSWLHVGMPEVLSSLTTETARKKGGSSERMRQYLTNVIGRTYNKWRKIGRRSGNMHEHVEAMKSIKSDVSDDEEEEAAVAVPVVEDKDTTTKASAKKKKAGGGEAKKKS